MRKFLKHFFIRTFLFLAVFQVLAIGFLVILGKGSFYKPQYMQNHFVDEKLDYLILGSSLGLTTLDANQIDSALNLNGYNASMDDTDLSVHLMVLEEFCRVNPAPDFVVLSVSPYDLRAEKVEISDNAYRFLTYTDSPIVKSYFSQKDDTFLGVFRNYQIIPFVSVAYFNKEIIFPALLSIVKPDYQYRFDEKGNYSYPKRSGDKELVSEFSSINYHIGNQKFQEIVEFCNSRNINLIVYQSPIYDQTIVDDSIPKVGLFVNHSSFLTEKEFFYDNIHVNSEGRFLCTQDFIEKFKDYLDNGSLGMN